MILDQVMDVSRVRIGCEDEEEACDVCIRDTEQEMERKRSRATSPMVSLDLARLRGFQIIYFQVAQCR